MRHRPQLPQGEEAIGPRAAVARARLKLAELHDARERIAALERRMEELEGDAAQARLHARLDSGERVIAASAEGSDLTVSVITPTFDRPRHLARAIASVRAQTHERWELLVVDAGGAAGTRAVLEGCAGEPRIRMLSCPGATGREGRLHGIEHATGDLIAYVDDDNHMLPGWLHALAWSAATHPAADVFYGARVHDGGDPARAHLLFEEVTRDVLVDHNPVDTNVLGHRRGLGITWDVSVPACDDWDLIVRMFAAGHVPQPVPVRACVYTTTAPGRTSHSLGTIEQYKRMRVRAAKLLGDGRIGA